VRKDGFVSGRYHSVTVRIARQPSDTAIVADEEFPVVSDVPVELVVDISVEGSRSRLPKRTLVLDPVDDTAWTEPVRFRAPTTRDRLRVFVVVLHEGRTVQSLTLAGPIVSADSDPGAPAMTLAVDQSSAASSIRDRIARAIIDDLSPAADPHRNATARSIIVRPGLNGPVAFDPYDDSHIPEQRLNRNQLAIRTLLTKAFDDPPDGLAGAAGILVELAIQGVLLRNQLRRGADTFFEHDLWIHISSVGGSDLPLEIVYEHPMPRNDATVCRRALDGKIGCTPQCGDRDRDDRVCPFGFWATSKIIERRFHVDDRRRSDVSSQRTIRISEGAVVAISNRADNVDDSVSGRIGSAVQGFVDPAPCNVVSSWDEIVGLQQDSTRMLMLLVTHTIVPPDRDDPDLVTEGILDLPDDQLEMKRVDRRYVNPRGQEPGPVVLALGCDTGVLEIGLADFVTLIHDARAEVVLSAISPISGRSVASFAEELMTSLTELLGDGRPQRFGTAMTAARQRAITHGNLIGLALTTSGDADIQIVSV
jgi:hypothetical protein